MISIKALMSGNPVGLEICRHSQTKIFVFVMDVLVTKVTSAIVISLIIPVSGTQEGRSFLDKELY